MFYYHKGLTRAARRTVATAITIAGRQGCTAVDTGHLLLAMLQTGRGTAVEFLRRKQITVTALSACASQRACTGRPLHLRQTDIVQRGHSIECRICAEDADNGFMPSPGLVKQVTEPNGLGIRIDSYIYEGYEIPVYYDPMISKLIVHADTRERAIARMRRALDEYRITGVKTNIGYLSSILGVPDFERGSYDTSFLEKNAVLLGSAAPQQDERTEDLAMIVAYMNYIVDTESGAGATAATGVFGLSRWREFGKRKGVMGM